MEGMRKQPDSVKDFSEFLDSECKFYDCRVKCGDRAWDLHKLALCSRSKYFEKAFNGPFIEADTNEVSLVGHDPKYVDLAFRCLYSGNLKHMADVLQVVDDEMTAYRECWEVYKVGDYLDSDVVCDAVLDALEYNNRRRARIIHRTAAAQAVASRQGSEPNVKVGIAPFIGFRDSFVNFARMAYSHPVRKSNRDGLFNLHTRGIKTPFVQLLLFLNTLLLPGASTDFVRKLQEVPELLGDIVIAFRTPADKADPRPYSPYSIAVSIPNEPVVCKACYYDPPQGPTADLSPGNAGETTASGDKGAFAVGPNVNFMLTDRCIECIDSGNDIDMLVKSPQYSFQYTWA